MKLYYRTTYNKHTILITFYCDKTLETKVAVSRLSNFRDDIMQCRTLYEWYDRKILRSIRSIENEELIWIDRIDVLPEHRRCSIFRPVIDKTLEIVRRSHKNSAIIALEAYSLDELGPNTRKLVSVYKDFGFTLSGGNKDFRLMHTIK